MAGKAARTEAPRGGHGEGWTSAFGLLDDLLATLH